MPAQNHALSTVNYHAKHTTALSRRFVQTNLSDSHFIHGITFELFLWCDIAGINANITTERGVWWVILVVANASCQILFHCPVIRGKVEINPQKPQVLVGRPPF